MKKVLSLLPFAALSLMQPASALDIHVSPDGNDQNPATATSPLRSLQAAQQAARTASAQKQPVNVILDGGTYYLTEPLVFTASDSGSADAPVVWQAAPGKTPVISGGAKLNLQWKPHKDGIYQTQVPADLETEEIFINGERQILARYPNFDPKAKYFDGYAKDAISKERASRWANPAGGYFHAMHPSLWGDFTWIITGKDANGEVTKDGGWQNNRGGAVHNDIRFVENIFEELDAPGEWFLNRQTHTLYYHPAPGIDLANATVEATRLRTLVEFRGDEKSPARFINLKGLTFRHAARTVMDTREPLLRTDWAIYRGAAIFYNGAEDCHLEDALIDQVGGNAVFVNNFNRRITIRGTEITKAGASGICFVGDPKALRSPLFNYEQTQPLEKIDLTPGPLTNNYPADCLVEDCLITLTGRVEKQTAGVEIDIAQSITVRHCSIYDMPRSGINIGDGAFGGHLVEYCDVFDTVKETGDHGSFNSWGRDRFWNPDINITNEWVKKVPQLPLLDVVKPITLRNTRWRCDHGWDIDLDDGSSNYVIYNNLMLRGGLKLREGYQRAAYNNILLENTLSPHVWYQEGNEEFRQNIIGRDRYGDARMYNNKPWGQVLDKNLVHKSGQTAPMPALGIQKQGKRDENSIIADAQFMDPAKGDYRVKADSPALKLGFKNFPMDNFGVLKPALRAKARTPFGMKSAEPLPQRDATAQTWLGAEVRNILDENDMSAFATPGVTGVLVLAVQPGSALSKVGIRKDDVILTLNGQAVDQIATLLGITASLKAGTTAEIGALRLQKTGTIRLPVTAGLSDATR